jgi:porphobilinogen synthase
MEDASPSRDLPPSFARFRRLRRTPALRRLVRETRPTVDDLVAPLFITESGPSLPIESMPGQQRLSIPDAAIEARRLQDIGIAAVILFGIPKAKDPRGSGASDPHGVVQKAVAAIKEVCVDLTVIADVCLCEYTDHGHCGIVPGDSGAVGAVDNDATVARLCESAVSLANAGADVIAPSDMMDGRVGAIRAALDAAGHSHIPVMAYSTKFCSGFYGPFREAADSAPAFGDRRTYQMDPANRREAIRESLEDEAEGADILMIKPGLAYLDIVRDLREETLLPIAVYNVSGEYAMVKAAAANGWIDEERVVDEMMTAFKRAGADMIITYFAADCAVRWSARGV